MTLVQSVKVFDSEMKTRVNLNIIIGDNPKKLNISTDT